MHVRTIKVPLTVTAGAYSANDVVGGRQQLIGVKEAKLLSIVVSDLAAQNVQYNLAFFSSIPTDIADNDTFDFADADLANLLFIANLSTSGAGVGGGVGTRMAFTDSAANVAGNINVPLVSDEADGDIWFIMYTTGTPTYSATTDVTVIIGLEQ